MANINLRDIPDDLYCKFKAWCALRQKTVRGAIIEMMEEKIGEEIKKEI